MHIVKVDRDKQLVCVDELIEQITMEELQEQLPGHQPRYIVYRYDFLAHSVLLCEKFVQLKTIVVTATR